MPENDKVPVVATLTLADGRTFTHRYETERQYADGQEFWWTDGNAACDCNRSSFLNDEYHLGLSEACGDTRVKLLSLRVDGIEVLTSPEE